MIYFFIFLIKIIAITRMIIEVVLKMLHAFILWICQNVM